MNRKITVGRECRCGHAFHVHKRGRCAICPRYGDECLAFEEATPSFRMGVDLTKRVRERNERVRSREGAE